MRMNGEHRRRFKKLVQQWFPGMPMEQAYAMMWIMAEDKPERLAAARKLFTPDDPFEPVAGKRAIQKYLGLSDNED